MQRKIGLILAGDGARAAYQVGVLKAIAKRHVAIRFKLRGVGAMKRREEIPAFLNTGMEPKGTG